MGIVTTELQRQIQPELCGSGAFVKNIPSCKKDPPPIDFDQYSKWRKYLGFIPFVEPDEVKFAKNFKRNPILSDSGSHCVSLSPDFRSQLSKIVEGLGSRDGAGVPPVSRLHRMLKDDAPPPSNGFNKRYRRKAESLHERLRRIAELKAAGDPSAEDEVMDLSDEGMRICIVDEGDTDALDALNSECDGVLDTHAEIKGYQKWGLGAIGTVAGAAWAAIKTGRLERMVKSAGETWRKSRKGGAGRFWSAIRAAGAFFSGKEPKSVEGVSLDEEATAAPSGDTAAPGVRSIALNLEDKGKVETAYANVTLLRDAFQGIERAPYSGEGLRTASGLILNSFREALVSHDEGKEEVLRRIVPVVYNRTVAKTYASMPADYIRWFFEDVLEKTSRDARGLLARSNDGHDVSMQMSALKEGVSSATKSVGLLANFNEAMRMAARAIHGLEVSPDEELFASWMATVEDVERLMHDTKNVAVELRKFFDLSETDGSVEARTGTLEGLAAYDLSHLDRSLRFAGQILKTKAKGRGVQIEFGDVADIVVPEGMRYDLFRTVFDFADNSVEHSDPGKDSRYAQIRAEIEDGNTLRVIVEDNGSGIGDVNSAWGGERASRIGTGRGLPSIRSMADEHGWTVSLESTLGTGTTATIEIDISGWQRPDPNGSATSFGAAGNPFSAPLAGMLAGGFTFAAVQPLMML